MAIKKQKITAGKSSVKGYISIIIPTKDRPQPLKDTLAKLNKQTANNFEVIVVDSSKNSHQKEIDTFKKTAKYPLQYLKTNLARPSFQRHIGIEHAIGEYIVFIDDDFILEKKILTKIRKILKEKPNVDGGQANFHINRDLSSKIQESFFLTNGYSPFGNGNIKLSGAFQAKKQTNSKTKIKCVGTGCCFYRKKVFDRYLIDSTIPTSCASDLEFSCRASKEFDFYLFPNLKCHHLHFKSGKPDIQKTTSNFIYFQSRHFKRLFFTWWRVPFFLWSQVGYFVRFLSLTISKKEPKYIKGWGEGVGRVWKKIT